MKSCEIFIEGIGAARIVENLCRAVFPFLRRACKKKAFSYGWTAKIVKKFLQFCAVRVIMEKKSVLRGFCAF